MAVGDRERWNDKWAEAGRGTSHGSALVDLVGPWLPPSGSLLDIAGGGSSDSGDHGALNMPGGSLSRATDVSLRVVSRLSMALVLAAWSERFISRRNFSRHSVTSMVWAI